MSTAYRPLTYCTLAALVMGYGWGYRGTVGHEAGAMVPGALLGLAVCVASGRRDWQRRGAVAGLCGAAGWAWGGSLSYMEQTFYILSDSLPDVLFGYAAIFFLGALWAGCGGAVLGLGLTEPRSELNKLARVFAVVCAAYFLVYIYWLIVPDHREAYETFTVHHFHDGDWLSATIALVVSAVYAVLRPKDRSAAALFLFAAIAWWVGYGALTKLGGLRLAPLHRSESWGGVLGILVVLIVYLARRQNRAALLLCAYGCVGGGLAFVAAVFVHHPLALGWGPFENAQLPIPAWRTAEVSFGAMMGTAIAMGCLRLQRGGLTAPKEDADVTGLDVFAVFVMLIALTWINFRRHLTRLFNSFSDLGDVPFLGITQQAWYIVTALPITAAALFALYRHAAGDRSMVPRTPFGKGAGIILLLIWITAAGQLLDVYPSPPMFLGHLILWLPASAATFLLLTFGAALPESIPSQPQAPPTDPRWRLGGRHAAAWALAPLAIGGATAASMAMQDGIFGDRGRYRFGEQAYWRQTERLQGVWRVIGVAEGLEDPPQEADAELPSHVEFDAYRNASTITPDGRRDESHRWFPKNQYVWMRWSTKSGQEPFETPLHFDRDSLRIALPSTDQYLVLARDESAGV